MVTIAVPIWFQRLSQSLAPADIRVKHHIQVQPVLFGQHPVEWKQLVDHHSLLHCCDPMGGITSLSFLKRMKKLLHRRHRDLLHVLEERIFFHISGQFSILFFNHSAFRRLCRLCHSQCFQPPGIENAHMARLV